MKEIPDKSFDLGFSDPPWGHEYDGKRPMGINAQVYKEKNVSYEDKFNPEWNLEWFGHLLRICDRVVIAMGWKHFNWWVRETDPLGYFFWYFRNGQGQTKICNHNSMHPLLCYGNFKSRDRKFRYNCRETFIPNGFLRSDNNLIHPSPKPFRDWKLLIEELNPKSIFDPFAGSCPIGEVGEYLGIKWLGLEIEPLYMNDAEYRINKGTKSHQNYIPEKKFTQNKLI